MGWNAIIPTTTGISSIGGSWTMRSIAGRTMRSISITATTIIIAIRRMMMISIIITMFSSIGSTHTASFMTTSIAIGLCIDGLKYRLESLIKTMNQNKKRTKTV